MLFAHDANVAAPAERWRGQAQAAAHCIAMMARVWATEALRGGRRTLIGNALPGSAGQ